MASFLIKYARWIIAALGLMVFGITQTDWLQSSDLWQRVDGALIDRRYSMRPVKPADTNIVLVGLNASSLKLDSLTRKEIEASPTLQLMQQSVPWNRRVYAAVLDKLINAGAKVVVLDFVFFGAQDGDEMFAEALQKYKQRVVIGATFGSGSEGNHSQYVEYVTPSDQLLLPGTDSIVGYIAVWPDSDGVLRRGKYQTSLKNESGFQPDDLSNDLTSIDVLAMERFSGKTSPLPKALASFIDYQGADGTYAPLPVEQMFSESLWRSAEFNNGMVFSNKIVIVGPMAEIYHDIQRTPLGFMSGPEIHAQTISALLHGSWLTSTSHTFDVVLTLILMWLALEIGLRLRIALLNAVLLTCLVMTYLVVCQIAFTHFKMVLPMLQPLVCLVVTGTFVILYPWEPKNYPIEPDGRNV